MFVFEQQVQSPEFLLATYATASDLPLPANASREIFFSAKRLMLHEACVLLGITLPVDSAMVEEEART